MKSRCHRFFVLLNFIYFLRFPMLTAIFLISFPYFAFLTGASQFLENLFDLKPLGILFVTTAALLAAWSVMVTSRLVLLYCHRRFSIPPSRIARRLGWNQILLYGLLALPTIIGIYWEVTVNWHYNTGNWWKTAAVIRSEERRVGKGGRSRCGPWQLM